jgi:dsDNA-binding SOS-regulon protein
MKILELLDELTEEIENSPKAMFSSKRSVDYDIMIEIIHDLRNALPQEIIDAEEISKEKSLILNTAQEEAASIVQSAEDELQTRVSDDSVVQEAEAKAREIVKKAEDTASVIKIGAKEYADDILAEVENYFIDYVKVLKQNRQELGGKRKS